MYLYLYFTFVCSLWCHLQLENVIEFEPGLNSFVDKLKEMREASARVILLYAK